MRHRLFSFSQQSTRYVNFAKDVFFIDDGTHGENRNIWAYAMVRAAETYRDLIEAGEKPEIAKAVLPMSLATKIVVSGNVRQWRHFLQLRACESTGKVHPQMRKIAVDILGEFHRLYGALFGDLVI